MPNTSYSKLKGVSWTVEDAKTELHRIASWFGTDVEKTKAAFEAAQYLDTRYFPEVEDYAAKIKETVETKKA
jgi:hypothetical protein